MGDFGFGPSNSSLRAWVRDRYLPVVMVVATEGVEKSCLEKNGLTFVEMLRPFAEQTQLDLPLRFSGRSFRLQEIRLRLTYPQTMEQPTAEVIDTHLKNIVTEEAEKTLKDAPMTLQQIQDGKIQSTPWFLKYRQDFLKLLCFDAHETFDHPLGCILAVSSTDTDPIKAFNTLLEETQLPPLMMQEYMYPLLEENFGRYFVIVHDGSKDGQTGLELAREKLRTIQKFYGHENCALLLINTSGGRAEMRGVPPTAFTRQKGIIDGGAGELNSDSVGNSKEAMGSYLSKADLDRIHGLIKAFITYCFFPKLESRVGTMRLTVSYKRHSFASKFMEKTSSYLRSSLSGIGRDYTNQVGFKYYTEEAQLRQLGDLFFLLHRYEEALEVFNSFSVSKETHPKFYAGVQMMIGLCYIMIVGFGDPALYFFKAYDYYLKVPGKISRMLATRTALLHSAHCLSTGEVETAAEVLLKGYDTEEILRGALLLEQSAMLFLKTKPASLRKFAFKMALAGLWYYNSMFRKLSLRCYNMILDVYTDKEWDTIDEHIATMMLKFHLEQGDYASAFSWTMNMLTSHHTLSPYLQKQYIEWMCNYIKEHPDHEVGSIADFNLPVVHTESLEVSFAGERIYGSPLAKETEVGIWQEMENRFKGPNSFSTTTGLGVGNYLEEDFGLIVCGETVGLKCRFQNPLKTPIEVNSAQLLFEFERTDDSCSPTSSPVFIPENKFSLKESETLEVLLNLIPLTPGRLRIIGISWYLNGLIPGHKLIGKVSLLEEKDKLPFRAKKKCPTLLFVTLEPVPHLLLTTKQLPASLWTGEIYKQQWKLESLRNIPFRNLQITTNSPDLTFSLPLFPGKTKGQDQEAVYLLEGEFQDSVLVEMCMNPQKTETKIYHVVFKYESLHSDTPLRFRFLRQSFKIEVKEGLQIQNSILPSEIPQSYLLMMDVKNKTKDFQFVVNAVNCGRSGWTVQPLPDHSFDFQIPPEEFHHQHLIMESSKDIEQDHQERVAVEWKCFKEEKAEAKLGILYSNHNLQTLSRNVEILVEECCLDGELNSEGVCIFPVTLTLRNVGSCPLSLTFLAGDLDPVHEPPCWTTHSSEDGKDPPNRRSGLPAMTPWMWTGEIQCSIPCLNPGEKHQIQPSVVCFIPGSFHVINYSCKWKTVGMDSMTSGVVSGRPLYLNVFEKINKLLPQQV